MDQLLCIPRTAEADLAAMGAVAQASTWVMVIGRCQADLLEVALASPAAVLAVVPDTSALEDLRDHWGGQWPERLQLAKQLIGAEAGEQPWFHYNDPRHNGPLGLDALAGRHTNLKLERLELREQISLQEALHSWDAAAQADGTLVLIGAWAAALLHQAGGQLQHVQRVLWLVESAAPELLAELDQQLQQSWLVRSTTEQQPEGGCLWQRDPRLEFEATVLAERDQLIAQRDGLTVERDAIAAERDGLFAEREAITAERNNLTAERDQLIAQRDGLTVERDAIATERDGLFAQREGMQEQLDAINRELDDILALIDQAVVEPANEPGVEAAAQE